MSGKLLILADWFAPGVRAGGPIRSCSNLALLLSDCADVSVLTSAFDLGASRPYEGTAVNHWERWRNSARVYYAGSFAARGWQTLRLLWSLRQESSATVYLNSMFSVCGTLLPLFLRRVTAPRLRFVLAPRGMLKPTALAHKSWKKLPILRIMRWTGMTRGVIFHATSGDEVLEIQAAFPGSEVVQLPNVPAYPLPSVGPSNKVPGSLRLLFVGRIHPIKNLLFLLKQLSQIQHRVQLSVIGPEEDRGYADECKQMAASLPANISVEFLGPRPEEFISDRLQQIDAFVLPTEGENFGHAIFEAFAAGVPVIISDRTIWKDLARRFAGWDLPLGDHRAFEDAINLAALMGSEQHYTWKQGALHLAQGFMASMDLRGEYKGLFWPGDNSTSS